VDEKYFGFLPKGYTREKNWIDIDGHNG